MAWEKRKRGPKSGYYYLSVRTPEGVRKVYFGRRTAANITAGVIESRKEARRVARLAKATGPVDEPKCDAERLAVELNKWAKALSAVWLVLTGHHCHHGCWRRKNVATKKKKEPKEGSRAWEIALCKTPDYIECTILDLAKRAERGDLLAVENLEGWLKLYPDMRHLVRTLDDLTTKVEGCWVDRHTGADELAKKALRDEMAAMKAELLGSTPSILEKILASAVLIAHLSYQRAAGTASLNHARSRFLPSSAASYL